MPWGWIYERDLWGHRLALLTAAVIGKAVEFGSFKLPAAADRPARILLAGLGVMSLVIGLIPPAPSTPSTTQQTSAVAPSTSISETPNDPGPNASPSPSTTNVTPSGGSVSAQSGTGVGVQVVAYDTVLPAAHSVQLNTSTPTQSQYSQDRSAGDIYYDSSFYDELTINTNDDLYTLPGNVSPTYHLCTFNGISATTINPLSAGTNFCLKKNNLMLGITITGEDNKINQLSLHVIVWRDA